MTKEKATLFTYSAIAVLLVLLSYPVLVWLVRTWLTNPYYTHGFLIPPLAGLLAWRQWRRVLSEPRHGLPWPGLLLTLVSLGTLVWALRWMNHVAAGLALVAAVAGILLFLEGWPRLRHWAFPLLLLALAVPLPYVDLASPWFEALTARYASGLARLVGIAAVQQGGEISVPGTRVLVGAPCSGLRSLVTMVTVGVGWVYLIQGHALAKAGLLLSILPLVAISNVLRVGLLLVVAVVWGQEAALTYYHDWSSPVLFLLALGLFLVVAKVLGCSRIRDDIF
jgi:exosortase